MKLVSVKVNIIANLIGGVWIALVGIIFAPLYLKYVGAEGYAVIGLFTTLLTLASLAELGLSGTLQRELARLSVSPSQSQPMRDILHTLGVIYWAITIVVTVVFYSSADFLANTWFLDPGVDIAKLAHELQLAVVAVGLQLMIGFFHGGIVALQRQLFANSIMVIFVTARAVGAVGVLEFVQPEVAIFFHWQIVVGVAQLIVTMLALKKMIGPASETPKFILDEVRKIWRFSIGMYFIGITSVILTQLDKLAITRYVTLEDAGYYMLAATLVLGVGRLIAHMLSAIYPRLVQLVESKQFSQLNDLYHRSIQLVSVITIPAFMLIIYFGAEVVEVWTGDSVAAQNVAPILALLMLGTTANALMVVPYFTQLAFGWTRLVLATNLVLIMLFIPTLFFFVKTYGAIAAAWMWAVLNLSYVFIQLPLMHRKILRGELRRWYLNDVGIILVLAWSLMVAFKTGYSDEWSRAGKIIYLAFSYGLTSLATLFSAALLRKRAVSIFSDIFLNHRKTI